MLWRGESVSLVGIGGGYVLEGRGFGILWNVAQRGHSGDGWWVARRRRWCCAAFVGLSSNWGYFLSVRLLFVEAILTAGHYYSSRLSMQRRNSLHKGFGSSMITEFVQKICARECGGFDKVRGTRSK
jgi:hypothetical protein